jgi:hypothetical protein
MGKRISLEILSWKGNLVKFRIADQTHKWKEFGTCNDHETLEVKHCFISSNGLKLKSVGSPEWRPSENTLFVRGSTTELNDKALSVSSVVFKRIQDAIGEYNNYFNDMVINDKLDKGLFEI